MTALESKTLAGLYLITKLLQEKSPTSTGSREPILAGLHCSTSDARVHHHLPRTVVELDKQNSPKQKAPPEPATESRHWQGYTFKRSEEKAPQTPAPQGAGHLQGHVNAHKKILGLPPPARRQPIAARILSKSPFRLNQVNEKSARKRPRQRPEAGRGRADRVGRCARPERTNLPVIRLSLNRSQ